MEFILSRFIIHFNEFFGKKDKKFHEDHGRIQFMFYLRLIINGTGHFYIESQTQVKELILLLIILINNIW